MVAQDLKGGPVFAALVPPPEITVPLADLVDRWEVPGRRVPPHNLHLTLRFAGRIDAVTLERWSAALSEISAPRLTVSLRQPGAFPHPKRATVVWLGVESRGLEQLAAEVEEAASAAGLSSEERPFRPHVTLSRLRPPEDIRSWLERVSVPAGLKWTAQTMQLCETVGGRYLPRETFALT